MNDLLDLDFTSTSNSGSNISVAKPKGNPNYGGRTTFDNLASMRTNSPSPIPSRSQSPFLTSTNTSTVSSSSLNNSNSRSSSLLSPPLNLKPASTSTNNNNSGDAFSSLFGSSSTGSTGSSIGSSGGTNDGGNKSMAERLAKDNTNKLNGMGLNWNALTPTSTGGSSSFSGSDYGARSNSRGPSPNPSSLSSLQQQRNLNSQASSSSSTSKSDPWDFDLLSPSATTNNASNLKASPLLSPSVQKLNSTALLDSFDSFNDDGHDGLDDFPGTSSLNVPTLTSSTIRRDSFDLLGVFSQPPPSLPTPSASPKPSTAPTSRPSTRTPIVSTTTTKRSSSPPPHILGQLIEMGFSITSSQEALQKTKKDNGEWNLEGALEILVGSNGSNGDGFERDDENRNSRRSPLPPSSPPPAPVATGRRAREAAALAAAASSSSSNTVQDQATDLLAQASKIGFNVFKSANAYWATGTASVKKALVDEGFGAGSSDLSGGGRGNGKERERPKWMTEDVQNDEEEEDTRRNRAAGKRKEEGREKIGKGSKPPAATLFQDSDEEEAESVLPQRPSPRQPLPSLSKSYSVSRRTMASTPPPTSSSSELFSTSSPSRPSPSQPKRISTPLQSSPRPPPPSSPSKPIKPPRVLIPVTSSQLSLSASHKQKGNEFYKLGRFSEAVTSYSLAIEALPPLYLGLVVLLNNRGMGRLKIGDEGGVVEDCEKVLEIILGGKMDEVKRIDWIELDKEDSTTSTEESSFSLKEQLAKALGKRAKALEVKEKWNLALGDWKLLSTGGESVTRFAGGSKLVMEGSTRCRKMIDGPKLSSSSSIASTNTSKPKPKPIVNPSPPSVIQGSGVAVTALRTAAASASAEEDLKLSLKDSVDTRINQWKGGKETNLRALIASLDNVLWKELEWKKVGMHELIGEGQVKVRYVRAIGKVHPDKLNPSNTTVEQRMIAGGVFSALNDAFKSSRS